MKIYLKRGFELELDNKVCEIPYSNYFVMDVSNKEELSNYKVSDKDQEDISFENLYQLDIKITNTGTMTFFFMKESFKKEELLSKISALKDLPSDTIENKKIKVNSLIKLVNDFKPLFSMLFPNAIEDIQKEDVKGNEFNIIYVVPKAKKHAKPEQNMSPVGRYFNLIWKEKLFFVFLILAGFITVFACCLGVYNCYPNNAIYIFFFICALVGVALNSIIYKDIFKKYKLISRVGITAIITNLIGLAAGLGAFIGYFINLKNIPESIPGKTPIVLIGSLITLLLLIASIPLGKLILKLLHKEKT